MKRLRIAVVLALLAGLLCGCAAQALPDTEITIWKIGKADAVLIETAGFAVLVDAGEDEDAEEILDTLRARGIARLDALVITHFDKDHVGGADGVLRGVEVAQVIDPDYPSDCKQYREYEAALEESGAARVRLSDGQTLSLLDGALTLCASALPVDGDNDQSLCALLDTGLHRFLLTGDAEEARIDELLEGGAVACDVLKMPHHGRWKDNLPALLEAARPSVAIICDSDKNPADARTLALLEAQGVRVYETRNGDIQITGGEKGLNIAQ